MENKIHYINIFISSTFSDMHRERDLLHQIEGLINRDLEGTNYRVSLKDLRYGIDTADEKDEKEAEKKVLSQCFDVINECQFFILLLGDRYGSIFDRINISSIPITPVEAEGKSVTHLELIYSTRKIPKENMLIFIRRFKGDRSSVPHCYCDQNEGKEKIRQLRDEIVNSDYQNQVKYYDAHMEYGEYAIDELVFNKYACAYIKDIVQRCLSHLENKEVTLNSRDGNTKEVLNYELQNLIDDRVRAQDIYNKEVYEKLLLLRIQELLNKEDYTRINEAGGDGRAHLSYRMRLIDELPKDMEDLLFHICEKIAENIKGITGNEIYLSLLILAYAQHILNTEKGCLSGAELSNIIAPSDSREFNEFSPVPITSYDEYLNYKKDEPCGIYEKTTLLHRAFAYFTNCGILIHDSQGFGLSSRAFAERFYKSCPLKNKKRLQDYFITVLWYLPDPMEVYFSFLKEEEYGLFCRYTEYLWFGEELNKRMVSYLNENPRDFYKHIEGLFMWLIHEEKSEIHLIFYLFCAFCPEDVKIYEEEWVPFCQKIYNMYADRHKASDRLIHKYVLYYLYEGFSIELQESIPFVLSSHMYNEMNDLHEALLEMFFYHDMDNREDAEEYRSMTSVLEHYYQEWDDLLMSLQISCVREKASGISALLNSLNICLAQKKITTEQIEKMLSSILKTGYSSSEYFKNHGNGMVVLFDYVIRRLFEAGETDLCISMIHVLYEIMNMEGMLRKMPWFKWIHYLDGDLLQDLYHTTQDSVIKEMIDFYKEILFLF